MKALENKGSKSARETEEKGSEGLRKTKNKKRDRKGRKRVKYRCDGGQQAEREREREGMSGASHDGDKERWRACIGEWEQSRAFISEDIK